MVEDGGLFEDLSDDIYQAMGASGTAFTPPVATPDVTFMPPPVATPDAAFSTPAV